VAATDRCVGRRSEALGRTVASFAIRDGWRPSPERILRPSIANHASSAYRASIGVGMGAGLLSCLSVHHEDRGSFVWSTDPTSRVVGGQDAPLVERQKRRHPAGAAFGGGARLAFGVQRRGKTSV